MPLYATREGAPSPDGAGHADTSSGGNTPETHCSYVCGMPAADPDAPPGDDLGAVRMAAHAYEAALTTGDAGAATGWFESAAEVSRFGPDGAQLGPAAVAAARAAQRPTPEPMWLVDEVRSIGAGVALHLAVLQRGDSTIQRTQVWRHGDDGWRIAHAHVSRVPGPPVVVAR